MKQKEFLFLLGSMLIIIIAWVVFNIYHNYTTSTLDSNENLTIIPIEGKFDQDTINQVKNRKRVDVSLDLIKNLTASPSPTITPIPTIIASPSPILSPVPR